MPIKKNNTGWSIEKKEIKSNENGETKHCPFCDNEIKAKAIKCQYCWEFLSKKEKDGTKKKSKEETKECPFCLNKIDIDVTVCPFCDENLDTEKILYENRTKCDNWRHNRYIWILWLVILDIILAYNVHLSPYRRGECFWSSLFWYLILVVILSVITKKTNKNGKNNPTNTKLTAVILYILWYITLSLFIWHFWLF